MFVNIYAPVINKWRCTAVGDGRRCQMYAGHEPPEHAAAWSEPKAITSYKRGSGQVARRHWLRWNDVGEVREQEPGSERLPWACMGAA